MIAMNLPITIPTHRDVAWYVEECRVLKAALDGLQHPYIESRKRMAALETELDKLRAQIGTPPDGSHPDEQIPRAGTWHQERLNWISEIETARAYIAKCETQIKERAAMMRDVMRERDKAEAELKQERARLDWFSDNGVTCWVDQHLGVFRAEDGAEFYADSFRAAIDAAMAPVPPR